MDKKELEKLDKEALIKRIIMLYALIERQKNTTLEKDSLIRHLNNKVKYLEKRGKVSDIEQR